MGSQGLAENIKIIRMKPDGSNYTAAAGSSNATSDIIDTAGYRCITFIACFGAIVTGGVQGIKVQQDTDVAGGTMADLLGSASAATDAQDGLCLVSEIVDPLERYLRVVITRATQNSTVDSLIAILSSGRSRPVTSDATVIRREVFTAPLEGTA